MIVSVAIPLSFAITLIVLYADGPDAQCVHARRPDAGHGRLGRRRGGRAGVDPPPPTEGLSTARSGAQGTNAVALPVLASTLTTMAVLLAGHAARGARPEALRAARLTVAVAMMASYFVSMCVTPVACRYFLGHAEHGRFGQAVEAVIDGIADGYRTCCAASCRCGGRSSAVRSSLRGRLRAGPPRGCPARSSRKSTSRWSTMYVRFAPGISLAGRAEQMIQEMGKTLSRRAARRARSSWCSPTSARRRTRAAASTSPNAGPHMGFIRLALVDPEKRKLSQARDRRPDRARS